MSKHFDAFHRRGLMENDQQEETDMQGLQRPSPSKGVEMRPASNQLMGTRVRCAI